MTESVGIVLWPDHNRQRRRRVLVSELYKHYLHHAVMYLWTAVLHLCEEVQASAAHRVKRKDIAPPDGERQHCRRLRREEVRERQVKMVRFS